MSCNFFAMSETELHRNLDELRRQYETIQGMKLSLDMSRGKPSPRQLGISDKLLNVLTCGEDCRTEDGFDTRNYGLPDGVPELLRIFADLLGVTEEQIILGGNSSLSFMYDAVCRAMLFGTDGTSAPWKDQKNIKFLCPSPGYDRHFAISERFGIEMIPIRMTGNGPDMDAVEEYVRSDASVKGMWCVPKYSNPTGETYSSETIRRIAALCPAAPDFRVFWDMAYTLHDIDETPDFLENIFSLTRGTRNENLVLGFFSTSKITYAGAGIAAMVSSTDNIRRAKKEIAFQTISPDKTNQLRHAKYLENAENVRSIMKRHAAILKPKFDMVTRIFKEELGDCGFAFWTEPHGGYFLSLDVLPGTARRTVELCKNVGVTLTPAGSTFPYRKDPEDKNIRIAPSYPEIHELETAMRVVCTCAKLAAAEALIEKKENGNSAGTPGV